MAQKKEDLEKEKLLAEIERLKKEIIKKENLQAEFEFQRKEINI